VTLGTMTGGLCVGSVLFTDLVGFTEYNDAVGDAGALNILEKQTELANEVISGSPEARIVKELGDGLMIWFATAADGLAGAIAMLDSVNSARDMDDFPLAVRMGLHYGDALARGDDLIGQTVNIASRISDLAGPGELLVSESVLRASDEGKGEQLQPVGPVMVKGINEPVWLHRLNADSGPAGVFTGRGEQRSPGQRNV